MKRLLKLANLDKYLSGLTVPSSINPNEPVKAVMTTAQADATSALSQRSGQQILAARSELKLSGDSDSYSYVISTAIFVLEKGQGVAATPDTVQRQYDRLLAVADDLLGRITDDATRGRCGLLTGLDLVSVDVTPEASVFGGWLGYSIDLSFR